MESITIKVEENFAKEIEKAMKPYYSTKTEFIREAIRDKIRDMRLERAQETYKKELEEYRRKFPVHKVTPATYAEERAIREKVGKEYAKKFGIELE